jgi:hypothetical protein
VNAPLNGVSITAPTPVTASVLGITAGPDEDADPAVQATAGRLSTARSLATLRADLVAVERDLVTEDEVTAEATTAQQLRAALRTVRRRLGLRDARDQLRFGRQRLGLRRRQERWRQAGERAEARQRLWEARALRKRYRLTDSSAQLASVLREYRLVAAVLTAIVVIGIVWTSYGVAHALGGGRPALLFYGVEGLFSVPLLVIARMQMTAARHARQGRFRLLTPAQSGMRGRRRPTLVAYVDAFLLVLTVAVNVWPTLHSPFDTELFLVRLFPPLLIVIAVTLFGVAAELFGDILRDMFLGAEANESSRLSPVMRDAVELAFRVQRALEDGQFTEPELDLDTGLPSISAIQRLVRVRKERCQVAHDILRQQHELAERLKSARLTVVES